MTSRSKSPKELRAQFEGMKAILLNKTSNNKDMQIYHKEELIELLRQVPGYNEQVGPYADTEEVLDWFMSYYGIYTWFIPSVPRSFVPNIVAVSEKGVYYKHTRNWMRFNDRTNHTTIHDARISAIIHLSLIVTGMDYTQSYIEKLMQS